ncbi:MAG: hypothetical protein IT379_06590, partial [Deltaproteobacteria bacterium]|nr:hypothetical protein [Deltaproteobacteria bacterium]
MPYPRSLGLAVSLVSLLLAACGDDDGPGFTFADSTTPPPSPEGGPGPTPTPTPPGPVPTERVFVGPGAPADAPSMFGGSPAASGGPQIVYPAPGVVVPPNLRELEIHYRPGGHSVFELAITGAFLNLKIYVGCPEEVEGGCIYTPDEEVWDAFAAGSRGGGALEMVLRG